MGNKRGVGNSLDNGDSLRVGSSSLVADLRDEAIVVISAVVDSLDTTVGKVDRVRSLDNTVSIVGLSLLESSSRVVISDSVVVGVGGDLSKVGGSVAGSLDEGGGIGGGSVDHRGGIGGCGGDHRG